MKLSIKLATSLILAVGAVVGTSYAAMAGEGGASGSIAVQFATGNVVTGLSGAVAVGKSSAASSASTFINFGFDNETYASAIGGAGALTIKNANLDTISYKVAEDSNLGTDQGNKLAGSGASTRPVGSLATVGVVLP